MKHIRIGPTLILVGVIGLFATWWGSPLHCMAVGCYSPAQTFTDAGGLNPKGVVHKWEMVGDYLVERTFCRRCNKPLKESGTRLFVGNEHGENGADVPRRKTRLKMSWEMP
jgi:hypothetical protein